MRPLLIALVALALLEAVLGQLAAVNVAQETNNETWPSGVKNSGSGYGSISGNNIGRPNLPGLSGSTGGIAGGHGRLPGASGSATPGSHNCPHRETWKEGQSGSCGEANCRYLPHYPNGKTTACTADFVSKCFCKDQYVRRDRDNKCVKLEECDNFKPPLPTPGSHNCTYRETWKDSESSSCGERNCRFLPRHPDGRTFACTMDSVSKCFCKDKYLRRDRDNKCVKLEECDNFKPPLPTPGSHNCTHRETWKEGQSGSCGEANCRYLPHYPNGKTIACTLDSVSKCFCKDKYLRRDRDNECVKLEECDNFKQPMVRIKKGA